MRPCSRLCNPGSYGIYRDRQSMYTRHDEADDRLCALLFVRKHSLGTSWSNGWPRTWYSTRRSIGNTDTISSETVLPYRSPSAANAAVLGMLLRICSGANVCASAHTAAKAVSPSIDRASASANSTVA